MKTSPYSQDLRDKVIKFLEGGNSQRKAGQVFNLSPSTVNTWYVRYKREGNCAARKRPGAKPRMQGEELRKYIKEHPNARLSDMSEHFGMSASGINYWLRKLKYAYKKKNIPTSKQKRKQGVAI